MPGDTFGQLFRVTNWGESHGKGIGVIIEGCPPLLSLTEVDIQRELDRRKPGQSVYTTDRKESDTVEILSGVFQGKTTGTPISMLIRNEDHHSADYDTMKEKFRPSHADYTYVMKYGIRDPFGGGRSSARLTAGSVAAGAIARKILFEKCKTEIIAYVKSVHTIKASVDSAAVTTEGVEESEIRCPDFEASKQMEELIKKTEEEKDSLGGVVECVVRNVPVGLGEPLYDKLEADLAKSMMAINATKGFETGSGFNGTEIKGSEHNDAFYNDNGTIRTRTNFSGGVQGGISNGMPIVFRVAFKPTATIKKEQQTVDRDGNETTIAAEGRHDACVLPRAAPIVEAYCALVLCDHYLRFRAQCADVPPHSTLHPEK
jgi:chorismate synthase